MDLKYLFVPLALFLAIAASCSDDRSETYGPEYEIDGIELSHRNYDGDTISANSLRLLLDLKSDNNYAQEYGINPKLISQIASIKLFVLDDGLHPTILKNNEVSQLFLMEESNSYNSLYQTISDFVEKGKLNSLNQTLYFTNQLDLSPRSEKLITDTISLGFKIELELENKEVFTDEINLTLIP